MAVTRVDVVNGVYRMVLNNNGGTTVSYPTLILRSYTDTLPSQDIITIADKAYSQFGPYTSGTWFPLYLQLMTDTEPTPYNVDEFTVVWVNSRDGGAAGIRRCVHDLSQAVFQNPGVTFYSRDYFPYYYEAPSGQPLSTPTGLYADNIKSDSATTHWTGDANASNYKVQYKAAGDTVWTETYTD